MGEGSSKGDYEVCGIPFEDRWKRFSEAIEVIHALWNDEDKTKSSPRDYEGNYYKLKGLSIYPQPIQRPHPPILIGSWDSEQGLRRVANYRRRLDGIGSTYYAGQIQGEMKLLFQL